MIRRFYSRVGLCELREANVSKEFLTQVSKAPYSKPVLRGFEYPNLAMSGEKIDPKRLERQGVAAWKAHRDEEVAKVAKKGNYASRYIHAKGRKISKKYGDTAKTLAMGIIGAPAAGAMMAGSETSESRYNIIRRARLLQESRVLDALKHVGAKAVGAGKELINGVKSNAKDLMGMAGDAVKGTVQAAHDARYGGVKQAVKNAKRKVKGSVAGYFARHPEITKEIHDVSIYAGPGGLLTSAVIHKLNLIEAKRKEEDEVEMPKKEYKAEHKKLIKILRKCKTAAGKKEADAQRKEVKEELKKKD